MKNLKSNEKSVLEYGDLLVAAIETADCLFEESELTESDRLAAMCAIVAQRFNEGMKKRRSRISVKEAWNLMMELTLQMDAEATEK